MKDNNNQNNIDNKDIYEDESNESEDNNNIFQQNIRKGDSLDKYFKPIEDNHESEDILKQLENLNLSEDKSFEMPQKVFEPLGKKKSEKNNTVDFIKSSAKKKNSYISQNEINNNSIDNEQELYDNNDNNDKYSKTDVYNEIKSENKNGKDIDNNINKQRLDDIHSNGEDTEKLTEILLKEKLNRICASIQGYTLNQKCYQNLNNFIPFLPEISQNIYQPLDLLFDVFIELLCRIKQEFNVKENLIHKLNDISLNNEGYEKKILKLKKEIKEKDKEIGSLINKVNFEKEKTNNNSKSKILEINSLKKENQQLNNKLTLYKNQIRKTEADYKAIQNKLRYYIFERENKNNLNNNSNEKNNSNNKDKNNQEEFKINNDKYLAIKKLNMSLVYLLKDINKNICKFDFGLNKIINNNGIKNNYEIDDLNNNIETNLLIDENNCKSLCKNFMFNMDIINNKIIDILKQKNDISEKNTIKKESSYNLRKENNYSKPNRQEKNINNIYKDKSFDNINNKSNNNLRNNQNNENYINNNYIKDYNLSNKNNNQKNNNIFNNDNFNNQNNENNLTYNYNKIGRNPKNEVNTKYEYHSHNYNKNNGNKNERKKNALNFLNFYNNDDNDLEVNIETRAAIDPKWYENCKSKKVGYVFDKTKLFTCNDEEDRTNGANRK